MTQSSPTRGWTQPVTKTLQRHRESYTAHRIALDGERVINALAANLAIHRHRRKKTRGTTRHCYQQRANLNITKVTLWRTDTNSLHKYNGADRLLSWSQSTLSSFITAPFHNDKIYTLVSIWYGLPHQERNSLKAAWVPCQQRRELIGHPIRWHTVKLIETSWRCAVISRCNSTYSSSR